MANRNALSRKLRRKEKRKRRYMPSVGPRIIMPARKPQPRVAIDPTLIWYVVRTNIRCERRAQLGLVQAGFAVWRPIEAFDAVRRGRQVEITRNLFVRYIFVGFDSQSRFDVLRDTHGVEAILGAAGCPLPISASLLQAVADEIAGEETQAVERGSFAVGQMVKILSGPFASFPGEIEEADQAKQRAGVAVNIFGRKTPVELDFIQLEAA